MIDVRAIPDRLEDGVGETGKQDVLDGFLAEIVVDAENLVLVQRLVDLLVQFDRRREIGAEGFLKDDPAPAAILAELVGCIQVRDDDRKQLWRHRQVVQPTGVTAFPTGDQLVETLEVGSLGVLAAQIVQTGGESRPLLIGERVGGELARPGQQLLTKGLVRERGTAETDDAKVLRQSILQVQVEQRRHQLAFGQVAGCAKNDDRRRSVFCHWGGPYVWWRVEEFRARPLRSKRQVLRNGGRTGNFVSGIALTKADGSSAEAPGISPNSEARSFCMLERSIRCSQSLPSLAARPSV